MSKKKQAKKRAQREVGQPCNCDACRAFNRLVRDDMPNDDVALTLSNSHWRAILLGLAIAHQATPEPIVVVTMIEVARGIQQALMDASPAWKRRWELAQRELGIEPGSAP